MHAICGVRQGNENVHVIDGLRDKLENNRSLRRYFFVAIMISVGLVVSMVLTHVVHLWSTLSFIIGFSVGEFVAEWVRRKLGVSRWPAESPPAKPPSRLRVAGNVAFAAFMAAAPIAFLAHEAGLPVNLDIAIAAAAILLTALWFTRKRVTFDGYPAGILALGAMALLGLLAYTAEDHGVPPLAAIAGWAVLSLTCIMFAKKKLNELERRWSPVGDAQDQRSGGVP